MSADNWAVCPKCREKSAKDAACMAEHAKAVYGKVSPEEWVELSRKAELAKTRVPDEHLREDYGIGLTEDGGFHASYRCRCQDCGFEFTYKVALTAEEVEEAVKYQAKPRRKGPR